MAVDGGERNTTDALGHSARFYLQSIAASPVRPLPTPMTAVWSAMVEATLFTIRELPSMHSAGDSADRSSTVCSIRMLEGLGEDSDAAIAREGVEVEIRGFDSLCVVDGRCGPHRVGGEQREHAGSLCTPRVSVGSRRCSSMAP